MHAQGIITLHNLLRTLNTTKNKKNPCKRQRSQFKRKSQSKDGLHNPPQLLVSLVMDKEYIEIFLGGIKE